MSLYHQPGTNQIVQHEVQTYSRNWTRLTGDISTNPDEDSLMWVDRHHETKCPDKKTPELNEIRTPYHK